MAIRGRRSAAPLLAGVPVILVLAGSVEAEERGDAPPSSDSVQIAGEVVDQVSGEGLPAVAVSFFSAEPEGRLVWRGATDLSGHFVSPRIPAGSYELRIQALGFADLSETVTLTASERMELRVELVPEALELEPIVVTSWRRSHLEDAGFYQRRRMGVGYTLTREEIEARNPFMVSDLFRMIPGARVAPVRGGRGGAILLRGGCRPDIIVDGVRVGSIADIDEILSVGDLEALEVYHGAFQPVAVSHNSCGTVMAWTRRGEREGGEPLTWARFLVAAAFVALSVVATR